jgi:hypothetical protein
MKKSKQFLFLFLSLFLTFQAWGQSRSFFTTIPKSTLFILTDGDLPKGVDLKVFPNKIGPQTKMESSSEDKKGEEEHHYIYVVMAELLPDVNIPQESIEVKIKSKVAITQNQDGEKVTNEETTEFTTPDASKVYRLDGKIQFIDDPGIKDQQLINNPSAYPISYLGKFHVQFSRDGEVVREAVYQVKLDKDKKDSAPPKADFQLIDSIDEPEPQETPEEPLNDKPEEFLDELPPEEENSQPEE